MSGSITVGGVFNWNTPSPANVTDLNGLVATAIADATAAAASASAAATSATAAAASATEAASEASGNVFSSLPTTKPTTAGQPWNNGGVVQISDGLGGSY